MLSDPQERAWYDDHREAILRGGSGADDDGPKDGMNVMAYFSGSVFRGFGDDPGGFYASYGEIFQDLFEDRASVFEDPDVVFRPFVRCILLVTRVIMPTRFQSLCPLAENHVVSDLLVDGAWVRACGPCMCVYFG